MDLTDRWRWMRRNIDAGNISWDRVDPTAKCLRIQLPESNSFIKQINKLLRYRKIIIVVLFILAFMIYLGPYVIRLLFSSPISRLHDPVGRCLSDRLTMFYDSAANFDSNIRHSPLLENESPFLPYVGNGKIGIIIEPDGELYLKSKRKLSIRVPFRPLVSLGLDESDPKEASVVQYTTGIVHRFQCFSKPVGSLDIHYATYAHRTMPALFVQDIKVTNPMDEDIYFDIEMPRIVDFEMLTKSTVSVVTGDKSEKLPLITGQIPIPDTTGQYFALAIIHSDLAKSIRVKRQSTESLFVLLSVHYMGPISKADFKDAQDEVIRQAQSNYSRAMKTTSKRLKEDHKRVWQQHWSSGFSISYSRASNALNGDKINATIYYVLSNTRAPLHEVDILQSRQQELSLLLSRPDRCYDGLHTLQASTLWSHLSSVDDIINVVSLWKLTLEKQGCQSMLQAGADGVIQAILLSLGALKFSDHHLEFCTHPKDLHRDYDFRRIRYGNSTHLNISVIVGEDNKASIYVALDYSIKNYYACDGGCLDLPVELSTQRKQFPVKLTDPPTAILYITDNKQHMEELKHTIHVKEVVEAPAHEHHIIALHRHGHHLGGLPTLFWVSIAFLVLVFHLFLFKLVYNEYCSSNNQHQHEKARARYAL